MGGGGGGGGGRERRACGAHQPVAQMRSERRRCPLTGAERFCSSASPTELFLALVRVGNVTVNEVRWLGARKRIQKANCPARHCLVVVSFLHSLPPGSCVREGSHQ